MGKGSKSGSGRAQRGNSSARTGTRQPRVTTRPTLARPARMSEEEAYSSSRAGARASRGFGYQHAVGAWVCAKVASGELGATDVIPEGLEDIQVAGDGPVYIQAKSRQASQGEFLVSDVLRFLRKMIDTRASQPRDDRSERLVLVLERGVEGTPSTPWEQSLADLPRDNPIRVGAEGLLSSSDGSNATTTTLLSKTAVVVLPWGQVDKETRDALSRATGLPLGAIDPLVHTLREEVCRATSQNASSELADRKVLSRQLIEKTITATARLIDINSLTTAVATGRCLPIDFETALDDPRFYEGIDVRPGHVVAGLPAPRAAFVDFACEALRSQHAALVTGPSGVGKSTVMWSAAYAMRDVLWFEIRRLERGDEEDIWKLLIAQRPTPSSPVGFVVDSIGTKDPAAWDALRDLLPVDGSVLLLGSIRTEDLSMLATAANAAIVECRMDEAVARELFEGLQAQGRTLLSVWEDAYNESKGLTLEYTYALTKGERLSAVLREQIQKRERQHRSIELDVLRLVATASRWGAKVPSQVLTAVAPDAGPRSEALRRLVGEHLIVLDGAHYGGLHQVRASTLSSILHETPPPDLRATAMELLGVLDPPDLRAMVVGCLFEEPAFAPTIIESLVERCQRADSGLLTTVLRALRTADFRRDGRAWAKILDANRVPQAFRPVTVWLALTDSEVDIEEDLWKPGIGKSIREMKAVPQVSLWRNDFLDALGLDAVLDAARQASTLSEIEELIGAVLGARASRETALKIAELPQTVQVVSRAAPAEANRFIGLLGEVDRSAGILLRESLGSDAWAQSVLRALNPWMVRAAVEAGNDGEPEASAELLYGSDWSDVDPHTQAVAAARTLLSLYPECVVRVRTITPSGEPLAFGDYEPGLSQLMRKYNQHPLSVNWNRERGRLALEMAMHRSDAERARVVRGLIIEVDDFLSSLTSTWVMQSLSRASLASLEALRQRLISTNDSLAGRSIRTTSAPNEDVVLDGGQKVLEDDDLHTLVDGMCSNLPGRLLGNQGENSLAAYVGDTLRGLVPKVRLSEGLRDESAGSTAAALNSIERTLDDLHCVLADIAYGPESRRVALASASVGARASALRRCAAKAAPRAITRLVGRLDLIVTQAAAAGVSIRWTLRDAPAPQATDWPPVQVALLVELESVDDWDASVGVVNDVLAAQPETAAIQMPLVVPSLRGRPLLPLAVRRGSTLFPAAADAAQWGDALGEAFPTPTLDSLQSLWEGLQAMSSLTLKARLRAEDHCLDDMPSELLTRVATAAGEIATRLEGSALMSDWENWQIEAVGTVSAQAEQRDLAPADAWVSLVSPSAGVFPEPMLEYLQRWTAVLRHDVDDIFGAIAD